MIVQRHFEIANFKPEDSWELRTVYRDVTFISTGDRFSTEEACVAEIGRLAPLPLSVTDVTKKKGREAPQAFRPHDIASRMQQKMGMERR